MGLCEHVVLLGVATTGPETQKRELTSLGLSLLLCQARPTLYHDGMTHEVRIRGLEPQMTQLESEVN